MVSITQLIKIGNKYYHIEDVQSVLDSRIQSVPDQEIDDLPAPPEPEVPPE